VDSELCSTDFVNQYLQDTKKTLELLQLSKGYQEAVVNVSKVIKKALVSKSKIYVAGNGGSAADAQHFVAELVSRFMIDRSPLSALALTTDTSCLTAIGNDYGFEHIFSRQLNALSSRGDVFIGITTSGRSPNIINAFNTCHERGVISVAMCGESGIQNFSPDYMISIPSESTPVIQEMHVITYHILCSMIETQIFKSRESS